MHRGVWLSFAAILILGVGGLAIITYGVSNLPVGPDAATTRELQLASVEFKIILAGCGLIGAAILYGIFFCCCLWARLQERELQDILATYDQNVLAMNRSARAPRLQPALRVYRSAV